MAVVSSLISFASQHFPKLSSRVLASSGYTLDVARFGGSEAFSVWEESTARRQDRAWQPIVTDAKSDRPREDVASLYAALDFLKDRPVAVLEVGSGGGHVSEILAHRYPGFHYSGVDISLPMISIATAHYPQRDFAVGSAYDLSFADDSIDVVIDGVALIHMPHWQQALREYARVAREYVVLHGLTLADAVPTTRFAKYAYGQPAIEFVFNRAVLLAECEGLGLTLLRSYDGLDYNLASYIGIESVSQTWVLQAREAEEPG